MGEVDVRAVETVEDARRPGERELVPAHVRHGRRVELANTAGEQTQALAPLVALLEEDLEPDADAEHRPAGIDAVAQHSPRAAPAPRRRAPAWPTPATTASGARGDLRRIRRDDRLRARAGQRRADAAQIAGAVVGEHDLHASPFVDWTPPDAGAHASRSARPSALNAASATWWSSVPAAVT